MLFSAFSIITAPPRWIDQSPAEGTSYAPINVVAECDNVTDESFDPTFGAATVPLMLTSVESLDAMKIELPTWASDAAIFTDGDDVVAVLLPTCVVFGK